MMLGDRQREKRLLQALRYAAKHEMTVVFKRDPGFPDIVTLGITGKPKETQRMTVNALALYKLRGKK